MSREQLLKVAATNTVLLPTYQVILPWIREPTWQSATNPDKAVRDPLHESGKTILKYALFETFSNHFEPGTITPLPSYYSVLEECVTSPDVIFEILRKPRRRGVSRLTSLGKNRDIANAHGSAFFIFLGLLRDAKPNEGQDDYEDAEEGSSYEDEDDYNVDEDTDGERENESVESEEDGYRGAYDNDDRPGNLLPPIILKRKRPRTETQQDHLLREPEFYPNPPRSPLIPRNLEDNLYSCFTFPHPTRLSVLGQFSGGLAHTL
ncbi:hypothetical protein B0H16DRAFT_1823769 [Mycena metata]|uniref:Uncharacterized protein n=1 Tax=Mycena metata TaxID=1033252 RepID=A0AAD7NEN5_9AGAR|nr:hypothetical protein B0H16DRAFT_1823769 [Mycena metata]